jgi:hypothetical protein
MAAALSEAERTALAVVPKVTGFASVLFSGLIVATVVRDRKRRARPYHRLLCGISLVDVSSSFWLALSTWPVPRGSGALWASGTDATCSLQGFFTQFGIASSWYNASLSVYFLLVIRYGWGEERIRRVEPLLHAIPLAWGLSTAISSLSLDILGNALLWCWISPTEDLFRWTFFYGPLWVMIFVVTLNSFLIFLFVRRVERAARRHENWWSFVPNNAALNTTGHPDEPKVIPPAGTDATSGHAESEGDRGEATVESSVTAAEEEKRAQEPLESVAENGRSTEASSERSRSSRSKRPSRFSLRFRRKSTRRRTKEVASQCFWYAGAFYVNWTALSVSEMISFS